MTDIDTLIRDLEKATEDRQYSLLREAVALVHSHSRLVLLLRAIDFAERNRMPELLLGVALSLVPEGYCWTVDGFPAGRWPVPEGGGCACVYEPASSEDADDAGPSSDLCDGNTPALALCIAALKARSAA